MSSKQQRLGQYFTVSKILQEKVYEWIFNHPQKILEPSVGQGHLVDYIRQKNHHVRFDMFEIDKTLEIYNNEIKYIYNNDGCITITDKEKTENGFYIKDVFVGMVSGCPKVKIKILFFSFKKNRNISCLNINL